jgi:hypothetical protein
VRAVSFQIGNDESVKDAVSTLISLESYVVVAIAFETDVAVAVRHAYEVGMIGKDRLWVSVCTCVKVPSICLLLYIYM